MHRLYSPSRNISADKITIDDKTQIHHLKDVLWLKINSEVLVFDDKGKEYIGCIKELLKNKIILKIKEQRLFSNLEKGIKITIACAMPKKSKMDDIIDKLTQLGVAGIIPLETERVIVKLDKNKKVLRQRRWEKIALSASVQSQRNILPVIEPVRDIKEVLSQSSSYDLKLIPTLAGKRKTLKEVLGQSRPKDILVLIGPEGDFTAQEVELAKKAGFIPISLGDLVLRVETAAVAVAAFIKLYYEKH
jgi:16S rRNA (uracil1498-N3)-methyltransferase